MLYINKIKHLLDLNYIYANFCDVFVDHMAIFFPQQKITCLLIIVWFLFVGTRFAAQAQNV